MAHVVEILWEPGTHSEEPGSCTVSYDFISRNSKHEKLLQGRFVLEKTINNYTLYVEIEETSSPFLLYYKLHGPGFYNVDEYPATAVFIEAGPQLLFQQLACQLEAVPSKITAVFAQIELEDYAVCGLACV